MCVCVFVAQTTSTPAAESVCIDSNKVLWVIIRRDIAQRKQKVLVGELWVLVRGGYS